MQQPIQISFHEIDPSETVTEYVRKRAAKLDRVCDRISSCRVVLEAPHRSQRSGIDYRVRVRVSVPRGEIVVGDHPPAATGDLYAAIDTAFDETARALETHVRKHRIETADR